MTEGQIGFPSETARPLRVGLIGAGRRIQNNFLPALSALTDDAVPIWVHSRTAENRQDVADRWCIEACPELSESALADVDVVCVSVPVAQNLPVLRALAPFAKRLGIVIDTPIAAQLRGASDALALLGEFRVARVAEDYMNYPEFELCRRVISSGRIGRVTNINLNGLGFRYHGIALLRSFVDFKPIRWTSTTELGEGFALTRYRLGGATGSITTPYRRDNGVVGIVGTEGTIISFPEGEIFGQASNPNIHHLRYTRSSGVLDAVHLGDETLELPELVVAHRGDYPDKSDLNLQRTWGLMQVLRSLPLPTDSENLNVRYPVIEALYDSMMARIAGRLPIFVDPMAWAGRSLLHAAMSLPTA